MSRFEKQPNKPSIGRRTSNTLQDKHLPSHITLEFWRDLISESEDFLSGLDPKVNQLWHHATHVEKHSRNDPDCQTIATKDFRLFQRSEEVRRHIYEICLKATAKVQPAPKGNKHSATPDEDIIAASYGAYSAHVVVDDMRTDEGDKLRNQMYRDFIFSIDRRYRLFRRLSTDGTKLYWDVILGCWAPRSDAFCVSFFPCPWIQEDALEWQPVFNNKETGIKTEDLYSGANGILTNNRICQLFLRGVLVIVPTDIIDRHGCDEYRIRIMDPDYPHLDEPIFEKGQAPNIDSADVEGSSSQGKKRGTSPRPADLKRLATLTFRDLHDRPLRFRGSSNSYRPSIPLLYWQFVTAMVKITWQIPPDKLNTSLLPTLHNRWVETWMTFHMGEYLTLGTTLAFSYLLNNPSGGISSSNASSFSFDTPSKTGTGPTIPDRILSLGCPTAFRLSELTPTSRQDNIHYSPILLLCNEILQRTPHPDDAGPNAWTIANQSHSYPHSQQKDPARRVKFPTNPTTSISISPEDGEPDGIVTKAHHRCDDCTAFELAVLTDVRRRGGNSDQLGFIHHHVNEPTNSEEEERLAIGSSYDYHALFGGGHKELRAKNKTQEKGKEIPRSVYDKCVPCQRRAAFVKENRAKSGLGNVPLVFTHHVPNRGGPGNVDEVLLRLGGLKLR